MEEIKSKPCFIPLKIAEGKCPHNTNGVCNHQMPQFQDAFVGDKQKYITCWTAGIQVNFED
jgi:hypothetical protein